MHQDIETTEQTYLPDEPPDSPEMEWFTYGSSFAEMGTRKAGYAIVSLDEV